MTGITQYIIHQKLEVPPRTGSPLVTHWTTNKRCVASYEQGRQEGKEPANKALLFVKHKETTFKVAWSRFWYRGTRRFYLLQKYWVWYLWIATVSAVSLCFHQSWFPYERCPPPIQFPRATPVPSCMLCMYPVCWHFTCFTYPFSCKYVWVFFFLSRRSVTTRLLSL